MSSRTRTGCSCQFLNPRARCQDRPKTFSTGQSVTMRLGRSTVEHMERAVHDDPLLLAQVRTGASPTAFRLEAPWKPDLFLLNTWFVQSSLTPSAAVGLLSHDRTPTALFASCCGVATAIGGFLPWIGAGGVRPALGVDHTAFSKMLVYAWVDAPFGKSVGFAVLVFGTLMVIGGLSGLRIFTAFGAVLALAAGGMWIGLVAHHFDTPKFPNSYYLNPTHLPWSNLCAGAWITICASGLGLLSTVLLRGWTAVLN